MIAPLQQCISLRPDAELLNQDLFPKNLMDLYLLLRAFSYADHVSFRDHANANVVHDFVVRFSCVVQLRFALIDHVQLFHVLPVFVTIKIRLINANIFVSKPLRLAAIVESPIDHSFVLRSIRPFSFDVLSLSVHKYSR